MGCSARRGNTHAYSISASALRNVFGGHYSKHAVLCRLFFHSIRRHVITICGDVQKTTCVKITHTQNDLK